MILSNTTVKSVQGWLHLKTSPTPCLVLFWNVAAMPPNDSNE